MKIPSNIVEGIRELIAPLDTPELRDKYRHGDFPRAELVKNLDRRYKWDLFYISRAWRVFPDLEDYTDDHMYTEDHIYTALKSLIPPL